MPRNGVFAFVTALENQFWNYFRTALYPYFGYTWQKVINRGGSLRKLRTWPRQGKLMFITTVARHYPEFQGTADKTRA